MDNKSVSEYIVISDGNTCSGRMKQDNGIESEWWGVCCFGQDGRERTVSEEVTSEQVPE